MQSKESIPLDAILGIDAFNIDNVMASNPQFLDDECVVRVCDAYCDTCAARVFVHALC
jgi:hypothetical protein